MRVLVTGCMGFIGSHFVKHLLNDIEDVQVVGLGRYSNTHNKLRIWDVIEKINLHFLDLQHSPLDDVFEDVEYVVNFAAKTFVDHSIRNPQSFIDSNVVGTYRLLEMARKSKSLKLFIQISTDEVYGAILKGKYTEDSPLNPTNPYAATKAAGDMLAKAYKNTYGLPIIVTRTENNYGPYQSREKVLPVFVRRLIEGKPLPVFGDGKHSRMWLHVGDHCRAISHLMNKGSIGQIYHVAGEQELQNLELAKKVVNAFNDEPDIDAEIDIGKYVQFIPDAEARPGHDRRYALDVTKLRATGWKPIYPLNPGLYSTVLWYKNNPWWFM